MAQARLEKTKVAPYADAGGGHTTAHDQFKWTTYDLLHAGSIDISCEVLNLFSHLIQQREAFEKLPRRQRQAIVPDFKASPAPPQIQLMDVKRLHVGAAQSNIYAKRYRGGLRPVDKRQSRVHRDYHNAARSTDRKFNNTPEDAIGPVEARLSSFGIIQGLVVGAFAEGSSHLHHLIDQYANTAANRLWRGMGARNAMEARNILRQDATSEPRSRNGPRQRPTQAGSLSAMARQLRTRQRKPPAQPVRSQIPTRRLRLRPLPVVPLGIELDASVTYRDSTDS